MTPDVVSVGEPLLEFNATEAGSLREVRNYEIGWGGDTSNFAIAASRLGGSVGYVCRLGADDFGQICTMGNEHGVDSPPILPVPSTPQQWCNSGDRRIERK